MGNLRLMGGKALLTVVLQQYYRRLRCDAKSARVPGRTLNYIVHRISGDREALLTQKIQSTEE